MGPRISVDVDMYCTWRTHFTEQFDKFEWPLGKGTGRSSRDPTKGKCHSLRWPKQPPIRGYNSILSHSFLPSSHQERSNHLPNIPPRFNLETDQPIKPTHPTNLQTTNPNFQTTGQRLAINFSPTINQSFPHVDEELYADVDYQICQLYPYQQLEI